MKKTLQRFGTVPALFAMLFLFTVLPCIVLLITSINSLQAALIDQAIQSNTMVLRTSMTQVDDYLNEMEKYSMQNVLSNTDYLVVTGSNNNASIQYAKVLIKSDMGKKLGALPMADGLFSAYYNASGEFEFVHMSVYQSAEHLRLQVFFEEMAEEALAQEYSGDSLMEEMPWTVFAINGEQYLVGYCYTSQRILSGAYMNLTTLAQSMGFDENSSTYFTGSLPQTQICAYTESKDTLVIQYNSTTAPITGITTLSESEIIQKLPLMARYTIFFSVLFIILPFIMVYCVNWIIIQPIRKLTVLMKKISQGDLDARIENCRSTIEIIQVNETFNRMLDEIQKLKIEVYEEKLAVQRAQLRNLQLQTNPHFLLNTLNTVYNYIETDNYALAVKMLSYASAFFRYMTRIGNESVPLKGEIAHVEDYLAIQSMRYPNGFTYSIEMDDMVADMLVLPAMIHCFAENAMKYALCPDRAIHFEIRVESYEEDYYPYARITIRDSGNGYPEELLEKLNAGKMLYHNGVRHLGIANTLQRLQLTFGDKVSWELRNENGAVCILHLPVTFSETDEEDGMDSL